MGLETVQPTDQPPVLNNSWPTTEDPINQGDNHIRNVKTVLKNFYADYVALKAKIEGYFLPNGDAKRAQDALTLQGQTAAQLRDASQLTGLIAGERISDATVLEPGVVQLADSLTDPDNYAATPKLIKEYSEGGQLEPLASDAVAWSKVIVGAGKSFSLPAEAVAILDARGMIEVRVQLKRDPGDLFADFQSDVLFLSPAVWFSSLYLTPVHDYNGTPPWKFYLSSSATTPGKFVTVDPNLTVHYMYWRRMLEYTP